MRRNDTRLQIVNVLLYGQSPAICIGIKDGKIIHIGKRLDWPPYCTIDGRGFIVLPGGIDGHVHFRHFGEAHKEDWAHACRAALWGGVTCVCDMGNHPGEYAITTAEAYWKKKDALGIQPIDYRLYFMCLPGGVKEFLKVKDDPLLAGLKLAMEKTTRDLVVEHRDDQLEWCHVAAETNTLLSSHVGNEAMIRRNRQRFLRPTVADHCVIRDAEVELSGGLQYLELLEETGARGEIKHVSTPDLLVAGQQVRNRGVRVSFEVCAHHWRFTDEQLRREDSPLFKMNPPLRTPEQVAQMPGFISDGTVDCIATDHAPQTEEDKQLPDYDNIPSGVPGVQEMVLLAYQLVVEKRISLQRMIDLIARNPAKLFNLSQKGEVAVGYDADIVLLDPQSCTVFANERSKSKCGWTPYHGTTVNGAIRLVVCRGKVACNAMKTASLRSQRRSGKGD